MSTIDDRIQELQSLKAAVEAELTVLTSRDGGDVAEFIRSGLGELGDVSVTPTTIATIVARWEKFKAARAATATTGGR